MYENGTMNRNVRVRLITIITCEVMNNLVVVDVNDLTIIVSHL